MNEHSDIGYAYTHTWQAIDPTSDIQTWRQIHRDFPFALTFDFTALQVIQFLADPSTLEVLEAECLDNFGTCGVAPVWCD